MPPSSSPSPATATATATAATKPRKPSHSPSLHHHHHSISATGTLDLLLLVLVLISGTFLITSYLSYLFTSLSLLLPPIPPFAYLLAALFSVVFLAAIAIFRRCSRLFQPIRCGSPYCKGLVKAFEFDLQLQTEDSLKPYVKANNGNGGQVDIEKLPWKGGSETNPDYECLRAELRKMAPPNGRAVLLFRANCGCPVAKLVGWGSKKGRKHKKALSSTAFDGDHR